VFWWGLGSDLAHWRFAPVFAAAHHFRRTRTPLSVTFAGNAQRTQAMMEVATAKAKAKALAKAKNAGRSIPAALLGGPDLVTVSLILNNDKIKKSKSEDTPLVCVTINIIDRSVQQVSSSMHDSKSAPSPIVSSSSGAITVASTTIKSGSSIIPSTSFAVNVSLDMDERHQLTHATPLVHSLQLTSAYRNYRPEGMTDASLSCCTN
jgi:hypothetical protein